jgi:hypothetical protein
LLLIVLVERAMHDSLTGGLSALHIPREGSIEINKLFQDPAVGGRDDDPLDIEIVAVFEEAMTGLSEASVECTASDDVDYQVTTNRQHEKLAQCLVDLRKEVGWVIPKNKMAVSTIQIPVNPKCSLKEYSQHSCKKIHKRMQNPRRARMRTCIVRSIS